MNAPSSFAARFRKLFGLVLKGILLLLLAGIVRCVYAFRDRTPGYSVSIDIDGRQSTASPRPLRVGFERVKINPAPGDPRHPVLLAGFGQNRVATRIHDDLWAVACVIDDGYTRVGIVALDAIGFFHDDVVAVRRLIPASSKLDYTIVCSTHNHSTPDLMGLWGKDYLHTGVDADYRQQVIGGAAEALEEAAAKLQPANVAFHDIKTPPAGLVADTRKPIVFDPDIRVMHFTRPGTGVTIGSLVGWANHPETPWSDNTEITADFPGVVRDVLEHGVQAGGKQLLAGLGGMHVYVNGAVGGLMTPHPSLTVTNPLDQVLYVKPSHDKTRALGQNLAHRIIASLSRTDTATTSNAPISVHARTIELPINNSGFLLAPIIGLIDRGHSRWKHFRTEVALLTLGDASIACIPGEIYPEIVNGGIERAPGGDFDIEPLEVPPIRDFMPGKTKFIFGLANDEIGYIIPKSEWDQKSPYLYDAKKPPYGEINSVGPDTARLIHTAIRELCRAPASRDGSNASPTKSPP
ncbi:MAG: hypothetical protein EXS31_14035 [Pedosphaera sp.]|nr:hypothetical protein [Pedosphaera sp.]